MAQLLIYTPAQFGGNRARGHELLREAASVAKPEAAIAERMLTWLAEPAVVEVAASRSETSKRSASSVADRAPLFQLRDAQVRVSDKWEVRIDELSARPGEVVGIIGANGAGKSVLIEYILGLRAGRAAELMAFGTSEGVVERSLSFRKRVGAIVGSTFLNPGFKVREIVKLLQTLQGPLDPLAVAMLSIAELEQNAFGLLSAGQQQRVRLLAAFHQSARLMVLDEPSTALDHHFTTNLLVLLKAWRDRGAATLLATHEERLIELCDQVIVIDDGRVVAAGSTVSLCESMLLPFRIAVSGSGLQPMLVTAQRENAKVISTGDSSATIYCQEPLRRHLVGMAEHTNSTEFSARSARPSDLLEVACGRSKPARSEVA